MDSSILNLLLSGVASVILAADARPGPAPVKPDPQLERLIDMHRGAARGAGLLPVTAPLTAADVPAPATHSACAERRGGG
jgi:hypothetical protein